MMRLLHVFFIGIFCAGVVFGPWWLTLVSGSLALIFGRSYFVLVGGVLLDLWFVTNGTPSLAFGFYTLTFALTTLVTEYVRKDLFWTS